MTPEHLSQKCLPVEQQDGRYVLSEQWLRCDLPLPDRSQFSKMISRPFRKIRSNVELGGKQFLASIFIPHDDRRLSFALLEQRPISETQDEKLPRDIVEPYLEALQNVYSYSEALLPEQRCYLRSEFIEPRFSNISDNAAQDMSWNHARAYSRLLIVGAAGAGKSSLLRYWTLNLAREYVEAENPTIPLYITLRKWKPDRDFETHCKGELAALGGQWIATNFERLAQTGAIAFACDGLDEVPDDVRPDAVERISQFADRHSQCRFIIATRRGIIPHLPDGFTHVELQPFTRSQIRETVSSKLYGTRRWKPFWSRLITEPLLLALSGNPLLLTLLLARYVRRELTPHYVTESLGTFVDALIDDWDSTRGVVRSRNAELSPNRKLMLLKIIADYVTDTEKLSFTTVEIAERIRLVISETAPSNVLQMLEQHTSLITHRDNGEWSFSHQLMQEYFASMYRVDKLSGSVDELVKSIIANKRGKFTRMFRFIMCLASDASDTIKRVISAAPASNIDVALSLSEAFAQKLTVDSDAVDGYAIHCRTLIQQLLSKTSDIQFTESGPVPENAIWYLKVLGDPPVEGENWAESLSTLLRSIYNIRDGSASKALSSALTSVDDPRLLTIAKLLHTEGRFHSEWGKTDHEGFVVAKVTVESPDLSDSENESALKS